MGQKRGAVIHRSKLEGEKKHRSKNGKEETFIGQKRGAVIHRSKLEGEKKTDQKTERRKDL